MENFLNSLQSFFSAYADRFNIKNSIIIVFIICLTLILQTPLKNYNLKFTWIIKIIAVYIAFLLLFVYMFINNDLINKHLPPIILIINIIIIVILLLEEFSPNNYLKNISLLSFIFLLLTFDYKRFEMKKGILINPDTKWIVSYAIVLSFWFLIADNKNIESNWIRYTLIILILTLGAKWVLNVKLSASSERRMKEGSTKGNIPVDS